MLEDAIFCLVEGFCTEQFCEFGWVVKFCVFMPDRVIQSGMKRMHADVFKRRRILIGRFYGEEVNDEMIRAMNYCRARVRRAM